MYAPDGALLSFIDNKKAMWYVQNNLAVLNSKNPLMITLNFEPNGRANVEENAFYATTK